LSCPDGTLLLPTPCLRYVRGDLPSANPESRHSPPSHLVQWLLYPRLLFYHILFISITIWPPLSALCNFTYRKYPSKFFFTYQQPMSHDFPHRLSLQQESPELDTYSRKEPYLALQQASALETKLHCTLWGSFTLELICMLPSYTLHRTVLHCILFLSYAVPSELHCTLWATLHPTELRCILLTYTTPYWATLHLAELLPSPPALCTLLSYVVSFWTMLHLLSNAAAYWATGHLTELHYTH
jgi:hypothetical protein